MSNKKISKKLLEEYSEDLKQIGKNLRYYRKEKGKTQNEIAEAVGLKHNTISEIERGSSSVKAVVLLHICKELEISFFDVFRDTQYVQTNPPKDYSNKIAQLNQRDQEIIEQIINVFYRNQKTSHENLELKSKDLQRKKNSEIFKDYRDEEVEEEVGEKGIDEFINQFYPQSKYNDDDYDSYLDN